MNKINEVDDVKVDQKTIRKEPNGDVSFTASVLVEKGWIKLAGRGGMPKGLPVYERLKGKKLEQLLKEIHDEVSKEKGERKEPEKTPVVEFVTPDVSAAFAKEPAALKNVRFSG
jgi:predicted transcriptional regulator